MWRAKKQWSNKSLFFFFLISAVQWPVYKWCYLPNYCYYCCSLFEGLSFLHELCNKGGKKSHKIDLYIYFIAALEIPSLHKAVSVLLGTERGNWVVLQGWGWLSCCLLCRCAQSVLKGLFFTKGYSSKKHTRLSFCYNSARQLAVQG